MEDKCDRCGERGEDRRTIWAACFYKMEELGIPFRSAEVFDIEEKRLKRTKRRRIATSQTLMENGKLSPKKRIPYHETIVRASGRVEPRHMYTLRVCKRCRADWMDSFKSWFDNKPINEESVGSGIFVRKNGHTVEISEREWYQEHPEQEPVRAR